MSFFKNRYVEYHNRVINDIDIHSEKLLLYITNGLKTNQTPDDIHRFRTLYINKINEIVNHNLHHPEQINKKICYFIANRSFELNTNTIVYYNKKCFFTSHLGVLIVLNVDLSQDVILDLNEFLNGQRDMDGDNLAILEDAILLYLIFQLLDKKYDQNNQNPIYDLSNVKENIINEFFIDVIRFKRLSSNDFLIVSKLLDIKSVRNFTIHSNVIESISSDALNCFSNLTDLKINSRSFRILVENSFSSLVNLVNLSITGLERVEKNSFNGLRNLKTLNLIGKTGQLKAIETDVFVGLENLECLDVSSNGLANISSNTFIHLKNLKALKCRWNRIKIIEENAFNCLESLSKLDLFYCSISPDDSKFDIRPNAFRSCKNLEVLNLGDIRLSHNFYATIVNLKNIKFLNLERSSITEIDFLNNFIHLEVLSLLGNDFETDAFDQITIQSLKFLVLSCTKMPNFNDNFKNLQVLEIRSASTLELSSFKCLKSLDSVVLICEDLIHWEYLADQIKNLKYLQIITSIVNSNSTIITGGISKWISPDDNKTISFSHGFTIIADPFEPTGKYIQENLNVSDNCKHELLCGNIMSR